MATRQREQAISADPQAIAIERFLQTWGRMVGLIHCESEADAEEVRLLAIELVRIGVHAGYDWPRPWGKRTEFVFDGERVVGKLEGPA